MCFLDLGAWVGWGGVTENVVYLRFLGEVIKRGAAASFLYASSTWFCIVIV